MTKTALTAIAGIVLASLSLWQGPGFAAAPLRCAPRAITCIEAAPAADGVQRNVPLTFGQPFADGDVPTGSGLMARDGDGHALPLQIDDASRYADGSLRFAILSTVLPELSGGEPMMVDLFETQPSLSEGVGSDTADLLAIAYDLKLTVVVHSPQVTQIIFGNRNGTTPGIPFVAGEIITLVLGEAPEERFLLTVTPELAGGAHPTLTKIAEAFMGLINQGQNFRAYKVGDGGGYEKLWVTSRDVPGRPFVVHFLYNGKAHLEEYELSPWQPDRRYFATVRPLLEKTSGLRAIWLKGPVATEFSLVSPLVDEVTRAQHPHLTARFNVRFYPASQKVRTDVVVENDWAYERAPENLLYDATITENDRVAFQADSIPHYHHARWHKVVWWGGDPNIVIRHNAAYLFASRMVWNYDASFRIPETVLADEARRLAAADTKPMGPALLTQYMPMTGGREDIGPLPRWTVLYLLSQDPRAKADMLANADAAGSVPIHYRDKATDEPLSLDTHPDVKIDGGRALGRDALPAVSNGDTPWTPDNAHQPSFAYVPYLVTGDQFYLDEILFWANWNMGRLDPAYRGGGTGLIYGNEVRAQAWAMRALGEAYRALPDHHPMKAYFSRKLKANLEWYVERYPRNPNHQASSIMGWVERNESPDTAPWQTDFLSIVFGQLAENGEPLAVEFYRWLARFTVGRWTHEAQGYCRAMAPAYYINLRTRNGQPIEDWGELFRENWPDARTCPTSLKEGYPDWPAGYVAYSRAMLAVAAGLDIEGAAEAYARLRDETPAMSAAMAAYPSWAIVPRRLPTTMAE